MCLGLRLSECGVLVRQGRTLPLPLIVWCSSCVTMANVVRGATACVLASATHARAIGTATAAARGTLAARYARAATRVTVCVVGFLRMVSALSEKKGINDLYRAALPRD